MKTAVVTCLCEALEPAWSRITEKAGADKLNHVQDQAELELARGDWAPFLLMLDEKRAVH